ncbi:MAG: O-antigen ligase family protein, partial [Patescibacteria group bacterium]
MYIAISKKSKWEILLTVIIFFILGTPLLTDQTVRPLFFLFFTLTGFLLYLVQKNVSLLQDMRHPIVFGYGIYVLWVLVSSLFGIDVENSLFGTITRPGGWFILCGSFLFFLLLLSLKKTNDKHILTWMICITTFIASYGILEFFKIVPPFLNTTFLPRAVSTTGNPIYFAGYLLFPLAFSLYAFTKKSSASVFFLFCSILLFGGILVSKTRGAVVGILLSLLLGFLLWIVKKQSKKQMALFFTIMLCVFVGGFLFQKTTVKNIFDKYVVHSNDPNTKDRLGDWNSAWRGFLAHPVKGTGYENYFRSADLFFSPKLNMTEYQFSDKPHNHYLEILVSSGVIGFILYLFILYS